MADSNYLTVAALQASKDKDGTVIDTSSYTDAELLTKIQEIEEMVERITNDRFYSFDATYYFDGNGKTMLFFAPEVPYKLLSVTSVKDIDVDGDVIETMTENDDYVAYGHNLEVVLAWPEDSPRRGTFRGGIWPKGQNNIQVVGSWGWSSTPKEIIRAVTLLCQERVVPGSTGMKKTGIESIAWDDYSVKMGSAAPDSGVLTGFDEVDRILERYMNWTSLFLTIETPPYHDERNAWRSQS